MAQCRGFRRAPREALLVWQCLSMGAVLSALAVAPATLASMPASLAATAAAVAFSAVMLARLLWSGHRTGTRLRTARWRHRTLVDALGTHTDAEVRVLDHATPTAYCLPGRNHRVVLTRGALAALPRDELEAVLAHERAHLRARHDLILEFFVVLHAAAPARLRAPEALREVRLLVEVLADRAARRTVGALPLARALMTLAGGAQPEAALGAGTDRSVTRDRLALLAEPPAPTALRAVMLGFAAAVLVAPLVLLALALG
jgi:Zn-dependent protease with chaperone function